jgi:hypothetical protein
MNSAPVTSHMIRRRRSGVIASVKGKTFLAGGTGLP